MIYLITTYQRFYNSKTLQMEFMLDTLNGVKYSFKWVITNVNDLNKTVRIMLYQIQPLLFNYDSIAFRYSMKHLLSVVIIPIYVSNSIKYDDFRKPCNIQLVHKMFLFGFFVWNITLCISNFSNKVENIIHHFS
jgi:3-dehydroquinate dehydratase